ncbi:MAG: VIT and VWA domain-containing protein, partial [Deltaproteobacteria bacterium]|nr:VIT and VWA domain-containing protein [Deltaproteobacteria bacterium]
MSMGNLGPRANEIISLKKMDAKGRLEGLFLEMSLAFLYKNESSETREIVFTFPLARGSVLLGLKSEFGGKTLEGTIYPKAEAQEKYEEAIEKGDAPILVEKSAEGLFSTNLGSLAPGEELVLTVEYGQLQNFAEDRIRVVIPTVIAPRYGAPHRRGLLAPHESVEANILAAYPFTLSLDISGETAFGTVSSPSHRLKTSKKEAGLSLSLDGEAFLDRDFILAISAIPGKSIAVRASDGEGAVALASFFPEETKTREPISLKILLDCSGSMAGASIEIAKKSLRDILGYLTPEDYVSYSQFGSEVAHHVVKMAPANLKTIAELSQKVSETFANMGGTELEGALMSTLTEIATPKKASFKKPSVLLLTDGCCWLDDQFMEDCRKLGQRIFII